MSKKISNLKELRARKRAVRREIAEIEYSFAEQIEKIASPFEAVSDVVTGEMPFFQQATGGSPINFAIDAVSVGYRIYNIIRSLTAHRRHHRKHKRRRCR